MAKDTKNQGGRGGDAEVLGDNSRAQGGAGGQGVIGNGGSGGHAKVYADNSVALGGNGGRGGLVDGGPGGDVEALMTGTFIAGGDGGEAAQADGRGGRGGGSFLGSRSNMRLPYGEPTSEPGRGGDGADAPQYRARRVIVERLKQSHPSVAHWSHNDVWYDRDVIPLEWINQQLSANGHAWAAIVVDLEYEFADQLNPMGYVEAWGSSGNIS